MTGPEDASQWFVDNLAASQRRGGSFAPAVSEDHRRCLRTLAALTSPSGLYNLPTPINILEAVDLWPTAGMSVITHGELSTYDFDRLTALVIAAHRHHVRVSVAPWLPHLDELRARRVAESLSAEWDQDVSWDEMTVAYIEIVLHARQAPTPGDHGWERHPGLDALIDRCDAERRAT